MNKTFGIDISRHQDKDDTAQFNDFNKSKRNGVLFTFIKATEGIGYVDPDFIANWAGAKSAQLYRGAYHFYLDWADPILQARHFFNTISPLNDFGELPPVIDVEITRNNSASKIKTICEETERLFGKKPLIYTSPYMWNFVTGDKTWAKNYPLWIAQWPYDNDLRDGYFNEREFNLIENKNPSPIPSPWKLENVKFWQFSAKLQASLYGYESSYLDGDFYMGPEDQFFNEFGSLSTYPKLVKYIGSFEYVLGANNKRVGVLAINETSTLNAVRETPEGYVVLEVILKSPSNLQDA